MKASIPATVILAIAGAFAVQSARAQSTPNRATVLRAAADALGMVRWSDIGSTTTRLPGIDIVNTMEFRGGEYHVSLGYNPPAMRVELTRTGPDGGAAQHTIQTVRDNYAWDESEIGAGLVPGKGTATRATKRR